MPGQPPGPRSDGVGRWVDEQPLLRAGLHKLLDSADDLRLLGDVGTGRASIEQIAASRPEVVLLEMCLAGTDGVEAVRQLTLLDGPPAVVVLPSVCVPVLVQKGGARGYLLKDLPSHCLVAALRGAAAGRRPLDPRALRALLPPRAR